MQHSRIILLGLFKCGLSSFTGMLTQAGYKVAFWQDEGQYIAELILKALNENKPLLHYCAQYNAFTQMDLVSIEKNIFFIPEHTHYKQLFYENRDAKFILNYRDINNHIQSIYNWSDLAHRLNYYGVNDIHSFIETHNKNIREFFSNKPNFIEFDIEKDSNEKLSAFLGFPVTFPHLNKTVCTT